MQRHFNQNHTKLSLWDVYDLLKSEKIYSISFSNFLSLSNNILALITAAHKGNEAIPLSLRNITVSYNEEQDSYQNIELEKKTDEHQLAINTHISAIENFRHYADKDIYCVSHVLESLLALTETEEYENRYDKDVVSAITDELQAFRIQCDHYANKNLLDALKILSHKLTLIGLHTTELNEQLKLVQQPLSLIKNSTQIYSLSDLRTAISNYKQSNKILTIPSFSKNTLASISIENNSNTHASEFRGPPGNKTFETLSTYTTSLMQRISPFSYSSRIPTPTLYQKLEKSPEKNIRARSLSF